MYARVLRFVIVRQNGANHFSTIGPKYYKVAVLGAAGGIGQPLSLLLKQNSLITNLALFDVAKITSGVATDLSHIDTSTKVTVYMGLRELSQAIGGAHVVIITAGIPRKPGLSRDDLFKVNASIIRDAATAIAKNAPSALVAIVTNPVNSLVPVASETLKKANVYDPRRVMGVTTLDVVRTRTFIGEINRVDPRNVCVPVIGGHSGTTIVPLLSQATPIVNLSHQKDVEALTKRIQGAGTEVLKAKAGGGSATLSMAYAAACFTLSLLKGLAGECNVVECTYVKSDVTQAPYFASPVLLGLNGVECNLGYPCISAYEQKLLEAAMPELIANIKKGERFITSNQKEKEDPCRGGRGGRSRR